MYVYEHVHVGFYLPFLGKRGSPRLRGGSLFSLTFFVLQGFRHILYAKPILENIDEIHLTVGV